MTLLRLSRLSMALAAVALVAGCSVFKKDKEVVVEPTAQELYEQADAQMEKGKAAKAAEMYDEVERLYPFSQLAKRALVMSAYASYVHRDDGKARASARRYLDLYPADEDAAYAQHIIAMTYYDNIVDVGRDQAMTRNALQAMQEVVNRYPGTDYARDAQLKIDLTLNHLAGKEMSVGRYYLKRGHYVAAINRFRVVVDKYSTTSQTPEALHRIVEANLAMGLEREALAAASVLGHNYPGSDWYANSYALLTGRNVLPEGEGDSFLKQVYRRVLKGEWL